VGASVSARERDHLGMDARLAVAEEQIDQHSLEIARNRERLHSLEAAGAAVHQLIAEIGRLRDDLTRGIDTLRNEMQAFTVDRIRTSVEEAFAKRGEHSTKVWDTRTKIAVVVIAALGWLTAVAQIPGHSKAPSAVVVTVTTTTNGGAP
jgi:chromosome segregation ATPase